MLSPVTSCPGAAACSGPHPGEPPLPASHQQKGMGSLLTNPFPESCFRALLMLSLWKPAAATRQQPHIPPLPTELGRALKKSWCFTCCHSETPDTQDSSVCARPRVLPEGSMLLCAAPPHRVRGEQHTQGTSSCPRMGRHHREAALLEKGRAEHKHRAGAVAPLGSARSCAGDKQAEKLLAWVYFHLGTPSSTESFLS